MNIVNIHEKTYERMTERFMRFTGNVKKMCTIKTITGEWADNQQVCELLSISKRTLQYYRDSGILPFSQIGHKCYYRTADIEALLKRSIIKK